MKILKKIGGAILALLIIVVLVIPGMVLYFLFLPVDMIRYFTSAYYKGTKTRFRPFITSKNAFKIYNYIRKQGLDIEYARSEAAEYFLHGGDVLISDPACDHFDQANGEWVAVEYGNDKAMPIADFVALTRMTLREEDRDRPIKFIAGYGDNLNENDFTPAADRPNFACIGSKGVI